MTTRSTPPAAVPQPEPGPESGPESEPGPEPEPGVEPGQPWVRIAADRCVGCLDCLPACGPEAIRPVPGTRVVAADSTLCTGCRDCVPLCPVRAIEVGGPVLSADAVAAKVSGGRAAHRTGEPDGSAAGGSAGEPDGSGPGDPGAGRVDPGEREPDRPAARAQSELGRRRLLTGAGLLGAGLVAGVGAGVTRMRALEAAASTTFPAVAGTRLPAVPFHGPHQAGILTPPPPAAMFATFDAVAGTREDLVIVMQALTGVARQLAAGGTLSDPNNAPPENGLGGASPAADGLTITVGVGASLFDERFGLAELKPRRLTQMPSFPYDHLDPTLSHGDVLIQLRAGHPDTVLRALRMINVVLYGFLQPRYRIQGFIPPPAPSGAPRNLQGFKHGIANPDVARPEVADRLLWAGRAEPAWAAGGSYHVLRIIRMLIEDWDQIGAYDQQNVIGRFRDSGAPLDGKLETDPPQYGKDPDGLVIRLDSHIRLANPRTPATADSQLLRAGYSYDRGIDANGNLDMGMIFNAYQRDLQRQFAAVQARLVDDRLAGYIRPIGGGYFFDLPGVRDSHDYYGRALFG